MQTEIVISLLPVLPLAVFGVWAVAWQPITIRKERHGRALRDRFRAVASETWNKHHNMTYKTWQANHDWRHCQWKEQHRLICNVRQTDEIDRRMFEQLKDKLSKDDNLAERTNESIRKAFSEVNDTVKEAVEKAGERIYHEIESTPTLVFLWRNLPPVKKRAEKRWQIEQVEKQFLAQLQDWEAQERELKDKFHQIVLTEGADFDKLYPLAIQMTRLDEQRPQK